MGLPPDEWIYEFYLNIPALNGQDIKMKSAFNNEDNTPSMFVFYSRRSGGYKWKCHSSGYGGNAITLVSRMFGLNNQEAAKKIREDFNSYGSGFERKEYVPEPRWTLHSFDVREFNKEDLTWWEKFGVSLEILNIYNVKPLSSFTLIKEDELKEVKGTIYGYFDSDGNVYKIYTPLRKKKFFKVKAMVQGLEQVKGDRIIALSSLKDVMSFYSLGIKGWKGVAPDSENTPLPQDLKIDLTLFDNDNAGYKAMLKYYYERNIPFIVLRGSKDLSDNIRDGNMEYVKSTLKIFCK
jgi:hypothetical protein